MYLEETCTLAVHEGSCYAVGQHGCLFSPQLLLLLLLCSVAEVLPAVARVVMVPTLCLATDFCSGDHSPRSEAVPLASCCVIGLYARHCILSLCVYLRMPSACRKTTSCMQMYLH